MPPWRAAVCPAPSPERLRVRAGHSTHVLWPSPAPLTAAAMLTLDTPLLPRTHALLRRPALRTRGAPLRVRAAAKPGQQQAGAVKQAATATKELPRTGKASAAQSSTARPGGSAATVLGLPATLPPPLPPVATKTAGAVSLGAAALLALLLAQPWRSRGCVVACGIVGVCIRCWRCKQGAAGVVSFRELSRVLLD